MFDWIWMTFLGGGETTEHLTQNNASLEGVVVVEGTSFTGRCTDQCNANSAYRVEE